MGRVYRRPPLSLFSSSSFFYSALLLSTAGDASTSLVLPASLTEAMTHRSLRSTGWHDRLRQHHHQRQEIERMSSAFTPTAASRVETYWTV